MRAILQQIFRAAVGAAQGARLLSEFATVSGTTWKYQGPGLTIELELPTDGGRLFVVGAGKPVAAMAQGLEHSLGDHIHQGLVITKYGHSTPLKTIDVLEAGHPLPDEAGVQATQQIIELLGDVTAKDKVIVLLGGGASALLVAPTLGLTLKDKIATTDLLLKSRAEIGEINTVRRHLSAVKGGGLLRWVDPAESLTLVISDVCGDDLAAIGSGPTVQTPTNFAACQAILKKYILTDQVPKAVLRLLTQDATNPGTKSTTAAHRHEIIATNDTSLDAAVAAARGLEFETTVVARAMQGETHEQAKRFANALKSVRPDAPPTLLLAGGETTLDVVGLGKGGRNQQFALAVAQEIADTPGITVLASGTDGTDGPTDAAGAFVDGTTWQRAMELGLDPSSHLRNNDAYPLFEQLGDLFVTGPTGTNVMDIVIGMVDVQRKRNEVGHAD